MEIRVNKIELNLSDDIVFHHSRLLKIHPNSPEYKNILRMILIDEYGIDDFPTLLMLYEKEQIESKIEDYITTKINKKLKTGA